MHKHTFALAALLCLVTLYSPAAGEETIDIGSRLELFVDDFLIADLSGDAKQVLQKPQPREVVLVTDKPWEGNTSAYYTIFQDGDLYRMYYRGSHGDVKTQKSLHPEVTCYAESTDGIHWTKPNLGLFEYEGSKQNNIVWRGIGVHAFAAFKDTNPACRPEARYKGVSRGRPEGKRGLYFYESPDGLRWTMTSSEPIITEGAFDSQNLTFWDPHAKLYREYHRTFVNGVRAIMTGTSPDYRNWPKPVLLKYESDRNEHLYTNAIRNYARAPHILFGFPTRYLPDQNQRVEPIFMTSRDGLTFHRYNEPVISEDAPKDRSGNRSNYMTWGMLQLPGNDRELSVYATEAYYEGPDSRVRRFVYRVDGFVAVHAENDGQLLTKPFRFSGKELAVNFVTANRGQLRIELQDADGQPLDGYRLRDCQPLRGDSIEQPVAWKNGSDVSKLAGRTIRLRFHLQNADLFSFRFSP